MPPLRTITPIKPIKTERTHEENQERAYIAASRRSDRSLEARVESARRASEIHKRRTGRSLRVTEADVINEEMYEEEDDDLPAQIRRITAHLNTGNDPFNRRLQAYLANHIAMRSALGQAVADNWQQQQQQQHQQSSSFANFLNPGLIQQGQQMPQTSPFAFQTQILPPQSLGNRSPSFHRSSPYPLLNGVANVQDATHNQHGRSASIATPQELHGQRPAMSTFQNSIPSHSSPTEFNLKLGNRRFSFPTNSAAPKPSQPNMSDQESSKHDSPPLSRPCSSTNTAKTQFAPTSQQFASPSTSQFGLTDLSRLTSSAGGAFQDLTPNPLSAILPLESQQLLAGAPASDLIEPAMAAMMQTSLVPSPGGTMKPAPGFYSYNPNGSKKSSPTSQSPSFGGLNATLAPGMLDISASQPFAAPQSANSDFVFSPSTPAGVGLGFESTFMNDDPSMKDFPALMTDGSTSSGQGTPGETDWNMWLESQALGEDSA